MCKPPVPEPATMNNELMSLLAEFAWSVMNVRVSLSVDSLVEVPKPITGTPVLPEPIRFSPAPTMARVPPALERIEWGLMRVDSPWNATAVLLRVPTGPPGLRTVNEPFVALAVNVAPLVISVGMLTTSWFELPPEPMPPLSPTAAVRCSLLVNDELPLMVRTPPVKSPLLSYEVRTESPFDVLLPG